MCGTCLLSTLNRPAKRGTCGECLAEKASRLPEAPPRKTPRKNVRTALYFHYSLTGDLLYIGIAENLARRGKQHAKSSPWVAEADHVTARWYDTRAEAETAEAEAIRALRPRYNKIHNR